MLRQLTRLVNRYRSFSASTILYIPAVFLPLIVEKLILQPLLLRQLGKDMFGELVVALAAVLVAVAGPASGFQLSFIREHAHYAGRDKDRFFRGGIVLTFLFLALVVSVMWALSEPLGWAVSKGQGKRTAEWIRQLCLYGVLFGCLRVFQARLRVSLQYGRLLVASVAFAAGYAVAVLPVLLWRADIAGWLYAVGPACGVICTAALIGPGLLRGRMTSVPDLRVYARTVPHFAGTGILMLAQPYAVRLYLGAVVESSMVTVFFAGSVMAMLFNHLSDVMGRVAYTFVATRKDIGQMGRRTVRTYLLVTVGAIPVILAGGALVGPVALRILYPGVADESIPIFYVCLIGAAVFSPRAMLAGFVQKFMHPSVTSISGAVLLSTNLVLVVVLTGPMGLMGAAIATSVTNALGGLAYVVMGLMVYRKTGRAIRPPTGASDESIE